MGLKTTDVVCFKLYSKSLNLVLLRFFCLSLQKPVICSLMDFQEVDWDWNICEIFNFKCAIFLGSYIVKIRENQYQGSITVEQYFKQ